MSSDCHLPSLSDSHGYMHTVWAKAKNNEAKIYDMEYTYQGNVLPSQHFLPEIISVQCTEAYTTACLGQNTHVTSTGTKSITITIPNFLQNALSKIL